MGLGTIGQDRNGLGVTVERLSRTRMRVGMCMCMAMCMAMCMCMCMGMGMCMCMGMGQYGSIAHLRRFRPSRLQPADVDRKGCRRCGKL